MEDLLRSLVLLFVATGAILHLFYRLRLPTVVGLIVAGVIVGPHGLGVLEDGQRIDQLAELGVVLLMFSIGLDFTPDRLAELARAAGLGAAQMLICIAVTAVTAIAFVGDWPQAILLGFFVALSSSTMIFKLFLERGELDSPHVRIAIGINIIQDLASVPMLLAIPAMAGHDGTGRLAEFAFALIKAAFVFAVALGLSRWVIPRWLHHVVLSRSRELLLLFLFTVCLGTVWVTMALGLPVALGAFLGGLAIAGSEYRHQTLAEIVPFRDLLVSLFFISIGMLLDVRTLAGYAVPAMLVIPAVMTLKFASAAIPILLHGYPLRVATLTGLGVAHIGEFSFVIAHTGHEATLIGDKLFQFFVLVAIATMLVNPFLISAGPRIVRALSQVQWLRRLEQREMPHDTAVAAPPEGHVIISGYGLNGRNLAQALRSLELPYLVLDLNPDSVRRARLDGESITFGDCTQAEVLRKANLGAAKVYVVAVSDPRATRQSIQVARHENTGLHIIARTKYLSEIEALRRLGADAVIAEEFETSLEILGHALAAFDLPRRRVEEIVEHFRGDAYEAFQGRPAPRLDPDLLRSLASEMEIETVTVPDGSAAAGKDLRELDLRARTGTTVLAVQRAGELMTLPVAEFRLRERDTIVLAGQPHQVREAEKLLGTTAEPPG